MKNETIKKLLELIYILQDELLTEDGKTEQETHLLAMIEKETIALKESLEIYKNIK